MARTLILGYGNVDRQDDGVAWHILAALAARFGGATPATPEADLAANDPRIVLQFVLQLTPELAETLAQYARVCFVDAHTGNVPRAVNVMPVASGLQTAPFTHHLTPQTLLAFAQSLYGVTPHAILVSVRGYEFGFARELSARTAVLVAPAVEQIVAWFETRSD